MVSHAAAWTYLLIRQDLSRSDLVIFLRSVRATMSFAVSCPCPNLSVEVLSTRNERWCVSSLSSSCHGRDNICRDRRPRGESNRRGRALFALFPVRCRLFAEALFPPVSVSCANTAAPLIHPVTEYARPLLDIEITRLLGTPSTPDYGQTSDLCVSVCSLLQYNVRKTGRAPDLWVAR